MRPADTEAEIHRRQFDVYRAMTPQRRVEVALDLSEAVRAIAVDGIRSRNRSGDEADVHREWLRLLHGEGLVSVLGSLSPRP